MKKLHSAAMMMEMCMCMWMCKGKPMSFSAPVSDMFSISMVNRSAR